MGYKQNKDGSWEQPIDAEKRVMARNLRNKIATGAFAVAAVLGAGFGAGTAIEFNDAGKNKTGQVEQIYQSKQMTQTYPAKDLLGIVSVLFGIVAGASAVGMTRKLMKDAASLDAIRTDIRDGMMVVEGGCTVHPYNMAITADKSVAPQ